MTAATLRTDWKPTCRPGGRADGNLAASKLGILVLHRDPRILAVGAVVLDVSFFTVLHAPLRAFDAGEAAAAARVSIDEMERALELLVSLKLVVRVGADGFRVCRPAPRPEPARISRRRVRHS